jgi:hypothetical protein
MKKGNEAMTKAIDLTVWVNKVLAERDPNAKKAAMIEMIDQSHAKTTTKNLFRSKVNHTRLSGAQIDKLAYDYMLSGEGMKVR